MTLVLCPISALMLTLTSMWYVCSTLPTIAPADIFRSAAAETPTVADAVEVKTSRESRLPLLLWNRADRSFHACPNPLTNSW
jgi:hypothetical protein